MDNPPASIYLLSMAGRAYKTLSPIARDCDSGPAMAIATRLRGITQSGTYHVKLPSDTENLCLLVLGDILRICQWPSRSSPASRPKSSDCSAQGLYTNLIESFGGARSEAKTRESIAKFCKESPTTIKHIVSRFDELAKTLDEESRGPEENNPWDNKPLEKDAYPLAVHALLLDGMRLHSNCKAQKAGESIHLDTAAGASHLTRLCLHSGFLSDDCQSAQFDLIAANLEMSYWQEMTIRVPIHVSGNASKVLPQVSDENLIVCDRIESPEHSKIRLDLDSDYLLRQRLEPEYLKRFIAGHDGIPLSQLLESNEMTPERKIWLSYHIARVFWQFYSTELMETSWTSEDILFMPLDEKRSLERGIPLRAFVSLPFGSGYKKSLDESYVDKGSVHHYPRILFLGVVLLEIALGRTLGLENLTHPNEVSRVNVIHSRAQARLTELKNVKGGSLRERSFAMAVENCLDSRNFKESTSSTTRHGGQSNTHNDKVSFNPSLGGRRDALYDKVVAPLQWLATTGFKDAEEIIPTISLNRVARRESSPTQNHKLQRSWDTLASISSFLSASTDGMLDFMEGFRRIAHHIKLSRKEANISQRIQIAILDTGCKTNKVPFFSDSARSERLKNWEDFVIPKSSVRNDTFGHGTLMTQLVMRVAPIADIHVIRVAENNHDLQFKGNSIAEAIELAGLKAKWNVDIISMSFDLSNEEYHDEVSDAIKRVRKDRSDSILFFASAGNSHIHELAFPARHKYVIPIYATDSCGQFLGSNAVSTQDVSPKLGIYGYVPSCVQKDMKSFQEAGLTSGSSIATAVAVGTAAMLLSYTMALPVFTGGLNGVEEDCAKLHTKKGMEEMLYMMSTSDIDRRKFINPLLFWSRMQQPFEVFRQVCCAVNGVQTRG